MLEVFERCGARMTRRMHGPRRNCTSASLLALTDVTRVPRDAMFFFAAVLQLRTHSGCSRGLANWAYWGG